MVCCVLCQDSEKAYAAHKLQTLVTKYKPHCRFIQPNTYLILTIQNPISAAAIGHLLMCGYW